MRYPDGVAGLAAVSMRCVDLEASVVQETLLDSMKHLDAPWMSLPEAWHCCCQVRYLNGVAGLTAVSIRNLDTRLLWSEALC